MLSLTGAVLNAASAVSMNIAVSMAPFGSGVPPPPLANVVLAKAMLPGVLVGLFSLWATKVWVGGPCLSVFFPSRQTLLATQALM